MVFTCTPDGRPSGEAFLEVASATMQQAALQRHRQQMGSRYIELFPASKGDALHAMQQNGYYTGEPACPHSSRLEQRPADCLPRAAHVDSQLLVPVPVPVPVPTNSPGCRRGACSGRSRGGGAAAHVCC